jgi:iron complex outermembrane receptor protein
MSHSGLLELRRAVRTAVASIAGVSLGTSGGALAQTADDVAIQEPITVTGSRIKRSQVEGPLPVTVIDRETIDQSGNLTVADVLRRTTYNTFGSQRQTTGVVTQGVNEINLRGLGAENTLVLLNGRRMAGAPATSGSIANLSVIPLAAVERIEILRDGASAIYGAEAIAGVVNVILREDYEGVHLSWDIGRPTQSGGDENAYSIVGGVSGAKGNVTFAFDAQQRDILFEADRSFTATNLSGLGFPGSYFATLATDDPRNPTGRFLRLGGFPDPRCPSQLGTDPDFPNSEAFLFGTPDGQGFCQFNYSSSRANEAENDTKSFFIDTNYKISDSTSFFAQGLFTLNESFTRNAEAPTRFNWRSDDSNNPTDPTNPTNALGDPFPGQSFDVDLDFDGVPDFTVDGPFDLSVSYRNTPAGPRDGNFDDTLVNYVAGVDGAVDWFGGADWQVAGQYSEQKSNGRFSGVLLGPAIDEAVATGSLDIFAVTDGSLETIQAQASAISYTERNDTRFRLAGGDTQLTFDAFQLRHGPVAVALGGEYRDEDFDQSIDEQTASGNASGGNQIEPLSGARTVTSLFAETVIPVLETVELNLAVRYDDYNDFGTTFNPKASLAFRPMDTLLLRASYGKGFQAPSLTDLYTGPATVVSFESVIDSWQCSMTPQDTDGNGRSNVPEDELPPGHPCRSSPEANPFIPIQGGNRDLNATESDQWSLGAVWSPLDGLSFGVDYYNIDIDEEVSRSTYQRLMDQEFALRQAGEAGSRVGGVSRGVGGRLVSIENPLINVATRKTEGVDLDLRWAFSIGRFGDINTSLLWTHVINYEESDVSDPSREISRDGDLFFPEDRGQLTLDWALGDFTATTVGSYTASQSGGSDFCFFLDPCRFASFTTWDVQASYAAPWGSQITIGARNVFDRDPPHIGGFYSNGQHDIFGRVPYIRWEQDL